MTKRQDVGSSWISKIRRGGTAVAAIGLLGSLAVAASGCDTVALISFSERSFTNIYSSGFVPAAGSCQGVGADGEMRARFVLIDNAGRPIRLGESVDNQSVELSNDSVELTDSVLMEVSETGTCTAGDCETSGFTCETASSLDPSNADGANLDQCLKPDGLNVLDSAQAVNFISDMDQHQVYGVLMENTGSLDGWNPAHTNGYWDYNADGDTEDPEDIPPPDRPRLGEEIATDPGLSRAGAVRKLYAAWETSYKLAFSEGRSTYFGLWSFDASSTSATSHIEELDSTPEGTLWSKDKTPISQAINAYQSTADTGITQVGANVYEAAHNLITTAYTSDALAQNGVPQAEDADKILVIFVDGYDDMRAQDQWGIQDVIDAANDNNVRIFVVHLDPMLKEPLKLRDDPMYPQKQTACSDDGDCKNYETCRKPRTYSDGRTPSASTTLPPGADYDPTQTYCIPERDEHGRTGPINDYARLACETAGGYMYVPSPETLSNYMTWTPYALDGLWEAKVSSRTIQRGQAPAGAPVRIHTNMSVTVAGKNRTFPFTQLGNVNGAGPDSTVDEFDTRGVVFTAE